MWDWRHSSRPRYWTFRNAVIGVRKVSLWVDAVEKVGFRLDRALWIDLIEREIGCVLYLCIRRLIPALTQTKRTIVRSEA